MNVPRLIRTLGHLRAAQILHQITWRLGRPRPSMRSAPEHEIPACRTSFILKDACLADGVFTFLNISAPFPGWTDTSRGMLWAYNLNYMDWLVQEGLSAGEGAAWIDGFAEGFPQNGIGQDPYPTALRLHNWIKFFILHPEQRTRPREDSLYSQYKFLQKRIERHLDGNHLLEDAFALYASAAWFGEKEETERFGKMLEGLLGEQILPDGAHFEQSPMYHCILLERLLDCCNLRPTEELERQAGRMLGHLESIVREDGGIPLLNDSALGIAPAPALLRAYARRLGLEAGPLPLRECGYRRLSAGPLEATIDVGGITASWQPGHSHADCFNYELNIAGRPAVCDSGISTYEKNARRQWERSTEAHNTVTVNGMDSSEVWSGFRVGARASVKLLEDNAEGAFAVHDGFGKCLHFRLFRISASGFYVKDSLSVEADAVSRIHLAPEAGPAKVSGGRVICRDFSIRVQGASSVKVVPGFCAREFNRLLENETIEIRFRKDASYTIEPKQ